MGGAAWCDTIRVLRGRGHDWVHQRLVGGRPHPLPTPRRKKAPHLRQRGRGGGGSGARQHVVGRRPHVWVVPQPRHQAGQELGGGEGAFVFFWGGGLKRFWGIWLLVGGRFGVWLCGGTLNPIITINSNPPNLPPPNNAETPPPLPPGAASSSMSRHSNAALRRSRPSSIWGGWWWVLGTLLGRFCWWVVGGLEVF